MLTAAPAGWPHGICARWLFDGAWLGFRLEASDGVGFLTLGLTQSCKHTEE
jgi:hypothetical protein